jgi:small subunit ribosomal protein S8
MTDSVADFLTRIRNAVLADYDHAIVPASTFNRELARLLQDEGYIESFSIERDERERRGKRKGRRGFKPEIIRIQLKYTEDRQPVISGLERISKPGRRRYAGAQELPRVLGGMGTAIVTTSRGVMTANEARRRQIGGEVVAYVW